MDKIVQSYYDKYVKYNNIYNTSKGMDPDYKIDDILPAVEAELPKIIESKKEYILRDSYIYYSIEWGGYFVKELQSLYNGDNETLFKAVYEYLNHAIFRPHSDHPYENDFNKYVDIIEDDLKELCEKTYQAVCKLCDMIEDENDFWLLRGSLLCIFGRCYMNNELDKYEGYMNTLLNNTTYILADLALNNYKVVYEESEEPIIDRVEEILKNSQDRQSIK